MKPNDVIGEQPSQTNFSAAYALDMQPGSMVATPSGFYFMDNYGDVFRLTPTMEEGQPFIISCIEKRPLDGTPLGRRRVILGSV